MIKSMTGFGRSEIGSAYGAIRVEIKTVNHKFLEVSSRLPGHLAEFEEAIRKTLSQEIRRGKISLFISSPDPSVYSARLVLNEALAKEVFRNIQRLKNVLHLKSGGSAAEEMAVLKEVLHYPEVLSKDTSSASCARLARDINRALSLALVSLRKSRILEGRALERDFKRRLAEMEHAIRMIEKRIPILKKEYKKNLAARMGEFMPARGGSAAGGKNGELDQERLTLEVALYVKNSDVSEEITRLRSHVHAMRQTLKENGEVGRKIDFIAQEMTRESNTLGAKSSDVATANAVIQIKSAIEKIREQASNVE